MSAFPGFFNGAEVKLDCGCWAAWRPGEGVVREGYVITASAFLCPDKHAQGDFVS